MDENYAELDWPQFVEKIFNEEPKDPFTYRIELVDGVDTEKTVRMLGYFVMTGCKQLYDCELANLGLQEIGVMQSYLRSIGWDVEYTVEEEQGTLVEPDDGSDLTQNALVSHYKISFKPCSLSLDSTNQPDKIL